MLDFLGLRYPQTAVLFTSVIVGLLGNDDLAVGFREGDTPIDVALGCSHLVDDLFQSEGFPDHLPSPVLPC